MKTKKTNKKIKQKHYPSHYLAVMLILTLVLEGILIGSTSKIDWQNGAQILDMSTAVNETVSDMSVVLQPIPDAIADLNTFFAIATSEMISLLDMGESLQTFGWIWDGVNAFYDQASTQMAQVLDVSSGLVWDPQVAGAAVHH